MNESKRYWKPWKFISALGLMTLAGLLTAVIGCEKKEKVMEIQTPGLNLEVNKTTSPTGEKGVEVKSNRGDKIEIDVTHKKAE